MDPSLGAARLSVNLSVCKFLRPEGGGCSRERELLLSYLLFLRFARASFFCFC